MVRLIQDDDGDEAGDCDSSGREELGPAFGVVRDGGGKKWCFLSPEVATWSEGALRVTSSYEGGSSVRSVSLSSCLLGIIIVEALRNCRCEMCCEVWVARAYDGGSDCYAGYRSLMQGPATTVQLVIASESRSRSQ